MYNWLNIFNLFYECISYFVLFIIEYIYLNYKILSINIDMCLYLSISLYFYILFYNLLFKY